MVTVNEFNKCFCNSVADLRTAFGLLDRNRDGRVTASELQFMLQNLGIQVRDELINDLINEASHSGEASYGLGHMACSSSKLVLNCQPFRHLVGLLGWETDPAYTAQHREMERHIHALSNI
jgi:hypothetical protein